MVVCLRPRVVAPPVTQLRLAALCHDITAAADPAVYSPANGLDPLASGKVCAFSLAYAQRSLAINSLGMVLKGSSHKISVGLFRRP